MGREGYRTITVDEETAVRLERLNPPTRLRPKDGREAAGLSWKIRAALDEAERVWRAEEPGLEVFGVGDVEEEDR